MCSDGDSVAIVINGKKRYSVGHLNDGTMSRPGQSISEIIFQACTIGKHHVRIADQRHASWRGFVGMRVPTRPNEHIDCHRIAADP